MEASAFQIRKLRGSMDELEERYERFRTDGPVKMHVLVRFEEIWLTFSDGNPDLLCPMMMRFLVFRVPKNVFR